MMDFQFGFGFRDSSSNLGNNELRSKDSEENNGNGVTVVGPFPIVCPGTEAVAR